MGALRCAVIALVFVVSCKDSATADTPPKPADTPPKPAAAPPTPPPKPAVAPTPPPATALPELATKELYRAPGGGALFRYPSDKLLGKTWTHKLDKQNDVTVIQLVHADGARRAVLELRFPPSQPKPVAARALAEAGAATVAKTMTGSKILGGQALPLTGGSAWGVGLETTLGGAKVVIGVVAVTDGGNAVIATTIAHAELYEAPAVKPVLDAVFAGIQVGSKVPRAPALSPGAALSGVFIRIGPALGEVHLFQFDPRGWVLTDDDVGTLDVDAAFALRGAKLDRYAATATTVRVTDARGRTTDFERNGADLTSDGRSYCRAARTDGLTLSGRWESPSFSHATNVVGETFTAHASSSYVFATDGTYQDASFVSATLSTPVTPGGPATPDVMAGRDGSEEGRYKIAGDRLVLTRAGRTRSLPLYARDCGGKGISRDLLVINGSLYIHDD